mmetsp:Transcript_2840/g.4303  ORF Transcript_2840/g.4303 Transcript_2840/m.4303 type:complete len:734 (+) Transcript_2840:56-2257(+)
MYLFSTLFALYTIPSLAQVLKTTRPQPHPLNTPSISSCCSHIDDVLTLSDCANKSISMSGTANKVAFVTYLGVDDSSQFNIPDIMKFGSYMIASTAAYAEQNGYSFHWLSPETGSNYQTGDPRWNKVKIIDVALDPTNGWAKDTEYLVWMDADAIVLDLGMKIELIGQQYEKADFIASADIRQGYLNSGFLIMRNTPWLRKFVKEWWTVVDRNVKCDQDAFDVLYESYMRDFNSGKRYVGDIKEKVAILERDALNSDPPAMTHQKEYNQVMHLMGEITPQRSTVFRKAFESICTSATTNKPLASQLNVNQAFLLSTASDVYSDHVQELIEKATLPNATVNEFNALSVASHHLADIYSTIGDDESHRKYQQMYVNIYDITVDWLSGFEKKMQEAGGNVPSALSEYIYMLKRTAENGNDLFHALTNIGQKKSIANEVLKVLNKLYTLLHEKSKPFAQHMSALMYHNLGELMYNQFTMLQDKSTDVAREYNEEALKYELKAVELMKKHFDFTDNKSIAREFIGCLQLAAILHCNLKQYSKASAMWRTTIEKAERLAAGVKIGNHYSMLKGIYFNAAVCDLGHRNYKSAKERLDRMMVVVEDTGGYDVNNPPREIQAAFAAYSEIEKGLLLNEVEVDDDEWEECEEGDPDCVEMEVEVDSNGKITTLTQPKTITLEEIDDWEECSPGDEDCVEVEVEVEDDTVDDYEDDDYDDEEERELAEIRAQYAEQSKRFHADQ